MQCENKFLNQIIIMFTKMSLCSTSSCSLLGGINDYTLFILLIVWACMVALCSNDLCQP